MSVWSIVGWVVCAGLVGLVVSVAVGVTGHAVIAVLQDALVYLLGLGWIVAVLALWHGHAVLAAVAAGLGVAHVRLLWPRVVPNRLPRWAAHARGPAVRLAVVNVFVDNDTPEELARAVVDAAPDVIVFAEWNPRFVAAFDAAGGDAAYPHRLFDPADDSDYAVAVVARRPFGADAAMVRRGPLAAAQAVVPIGRDRLTVIALNPRAVVDPAGYPVWDAQLDELHRHLHHLRGPFVVAGDLNTTTFRPRLRRLLSLGLLDAHESLGKGLSPSFKLAAKGALAAPGPVVRLDHVLMNADVRATAVDDLPSAGSDHVPFVVSLVVRLRRRPSGRGARQSRHRPRRGGDGASSARDRDAAVSR